MTRASKLEPLAVSCTSTDCENGLHCFLQKRRGTDGRRVGGPCRECGAELVEWQRLSSRDLRDASYTFSALRREKIRHEFWHRRFDPRAINHALRKGRRRLRDAATHRVEASVGNPSNPREGRQTPFTGNVLYYAQHSVAGCCRKCIEYWHGIDAQRPLTADEVKYLSDLIMLYIDERMPDLPEDPQKVAPIRSPRRRRAP
jgi:hypothetical protein